MSETRLKCAECGHTASTDFVAMADYCPACKASPFPEVAPAVEAVGTR